MYPNELLRTHVLSLISDYPNDSYWRQKVTNSVLGMQLLFKKEILPQNVTREKLTAEDIWIVSEEEIDFDKAQKYLSISPPDLLFPITVIRINGILLLYMGSVRSICFALRNIPIEAIVVEIPGIEHTNFYKKKLCTLRECIDNYKNL